MKLVGIIGTAVLSLTLGAAAPAYAQEEHAQDEHAQQEDKKAQPDKPAQQEEKHAQQEEKKTQQEKPAQQEEKKAQQEKPAAQHEQTERTSANHGRIPDDRFRANFGREHVFVINRPVIVEGQPRFQYGGYWFGFNQPCQRAGRTATMFMLTTSMEDTSCSIHSIPAFAWSSSSSDASNT